MRLPSCAAVRLLVNSRSHIRGCSFSHRKTVSVVRIPRFFWLLESGSNGRPFSLKPGRLGTPFLVPASPGFCASSSSLLPPPAAVAFGSVNSRGGCLLCRVVHSIWFKIKTKACHKGMLLFLAPRVRLDRSDLYSR